ncbi:hypothetical protein [Mesorhizobium sp. DCY119]|uniref:hypothetical protein n=1 Tax=Mesorhizobium sp. DCY119 TaxID=2108445 RepID=UPI000E6D5497|nr:hypothetical protein [Mesorhizobium sp. DCY119]RJG44351.1 hypothetical protein D3Y55_08840 [Mesorhizobium sp. DCY119]
MEALQTFARWFVGVAWLEVFKAVTTLVVGVAWPFAIVLLALIFRAEIRNKIKDMLSAGPTGVTFQPQVTDATTRSTTELVLSTSPNHSSWHKAIEESILHDLKTIVPEKQLPVLIEQLASARIKSAFEAVFSNIFGSQIQGLHQLHLAGGSLSLNDAEQYFESVKKEHAEFYKDVTFSTWFRYLEINTLARIEGDRVELTDAGREFLMFVQATKAGLQRAF